MQRRVLLVEDNEALLEVLTLQLQPLGYYVVTAKNGVEAVACALSCRPDVIVMDVIMPKMDGLEAISQIRNHPLTRDIPALAATGWVASDNRRRCRAAGFDRCITKPVTAAALRHAIEQLVKNPLAVAPTARTIELSTTVAE